MKYAGGAMNKRATAYPIGTPGQAWGNEEIAQWRAQQVQRRSFLLDVLRPSHNNLISGFAIQTYGWIHAGSLNTGTYDNNHPMMAVLSADWDTRLPSVLITAGVHGYETSGVHGALHFAQHRATAYKGRVNLMIVPCVSPWAYERLQRWNYLALDPNRGFNQGKTVAEADGLRALIASKRADFDLHIDLHETTNSDESEFRPALAARDGKPFEPGHIPDGFYLVADAANPQLAFQSAIIEAVARVTHIADADANGCLIGEKLVAPGVIAYRCKELGLCASITDAPLTTTTEVYPDSPRTTPEQCIAAQVAAVCAGIDFVINSPR
jgi:Succinylglutamate desuccinylase / Aspartoacylase family